MNDKTPSCSCFIGTNAAIVCRNRSNFELRGNVTHLTRHVVVFEIYSPFSSLQVSEVLQDARIIFNERTVYSGRAVVKSLLDEGLKVGCEATLEDAWRDVDLGFESGQIARLQDDFRSFMSRWQQSYRILPEYKIVVADMQSFLLDLRRWLEEVELGIRSSPSADRSKLEQEVLEQLGQAVVPVIDRLFEQFEAVGEKIEADHLAAHQAYMKRQLHPLVLCAPFAYRTFTKPLGYAGDYEMVNMIARNPFEGGSVFAKVLNFWFLMQPPAVAHRNRLDQLVSRLAEETVRVSSSGHHARVFNLGCGPAVEMQRFLAERHYSSRAHLSLLDLNEEALLHAQAALEEMKRRHGRSTALQFIKKSVPQLLKEATKTVERPADQRFDFIYCAGLFDYLTDAVCQRLMTSLYGWLAPGGLLLATNVAPWNPLRHGMDHLLDWHLVYRNADQLRALKPAQTSSEDLTVTSDPTGVNLFMEIRKHSHA